MVFSRALLRAHQRNKEDGRGALPLGGLLGWWLRVFGEGAERIRVQSAWEAELDQGPACDWRRFGCGE